MNNFSPIILLVSLLLVSCKTTFHNEVTKVSHHQSDGVSPQFRDNPWFVSADLKQSSFTYCIKIDESSFSAKIEDVDKLLSAALAEWKYFFSKLEVVPIPGDWQIKAAGMKIVTSGVRVSCHENPKVLFLFGGKLDGYPNLQRRYQDNTIAFAAMTEFDEELGAAEHGVVWFTPDLGERLYRNSLEYNSRWSHLPTLYNIILHELGHVFGIPDIDVQKIGIMSRGTPSLLFSARYNTVMRTKIYLTQNWHKLYNICGEVAQSSKKAFVRLFDIDDSEIIRKVEGVFSKSLRLSYKSEDFIPDLAACLKVIAIPEVKSGEISLKAIKISYRVNVGKPGVDQYVDGKIALVGNMQGQKSPFSFIKGTYLLPDHTLKNHNYSDKRTIEFETILDPMPVAVAHGKDGEFAKKITGAFDFRITNHSLFADINFSYRVGDLEEEEYVRIIPYASLDYYRDMVSADSVVAHARDIREL